MLVAVHEVTARKIVRVVAVDITEAKHSSELDRTPEDVAHFFPLTPLREKLVGEHLDRVWQPCSAEHLNVSHERVANEYTIFITADAGFTDVAAILRALELPLVAGDQLVRDPMPLHVIRDDVCRETAK